MPRDDDSIAIMLDYCCFNVFFPDGRTLLEVYVAEHPLQDDDQRAVLQAHQRSYFSLFEVIQLVPHLGARLRELFTDETLLVVYPRPSAANHRPGPRPRLRAWDKGRCPPC